MLGPRIIEIGKIVKKITGIFVSFKLKFFHYFNDLHAILFDLCTELLFSFIISISSKIFSKY